MMKFLNILKSLDGPADDVITFDAEVRGRGEYDDPFEVDCFNFVYGDDPFEPDGEQQERAEALALLVYEERASDPDRWL